jgi:hypothetical protein
MKPVTPENINSFCTITGEDATTATAYLESEEGGLSGAVAAYEADNAYLRQPNLQRGELERTK